MKLEQEDFRLAEALSRIQRAVSPKGEDLIDRLLAEVELSRARLVERRWKLNIAGKEIVLRDQLDKIVKAIQAFKDAGNAAVNVDPIHAGLPWAGILLVMQLVANDTDQYVALVSGVEEVSAIISRYKHVEVVSQQRKDAKFRVEFENYLIELYKHILRYQVFAARFYQRNTGLRFLRAIPKLDDVSDIMSDVRQNDKRCTELGRIFDTRDDQLRHYEILALFKTHEEKLLAISQGIQNMNNTKAQFSDAPKEVPFNFDPDPKFTGRQDAIDSLDAGFKTYRRMALVGWAGVGKSAIAIDYAHRVSDRTKSTRIYWVRGARRDAFLRSYRDLARKLKLPRWHEPDVNVGELFSDWLSDPSNGNWLMVLDNVDDETVFSRSRVRRVSGLGGDSEEYLQKYLPQVSHGSILLTSRNRAAARGITNEDDCIIRVEKLPGPDALALFRKKLPRDQSPDLDVMELINELEYLPLAITQAAAYISKGSPRMTITFYLKLFRSDQVRYLEMAADDIRRDSEDIDQDFSNSVLKTWYISFKHIRERNSDAAENLCCMSLMFGQGIPVEYLLCGNEVDPSEVEENIGPLVEYSLISAEEGGSTFTIHRLVQLSVRQWLQANNELNQQSEMVLRALYYRFPGTQPSNWRTCELLMPHVDSILKYSFSTMKSLENVSLLLSVTADYVYTAHGNWAAALERATKAHAISVEHFGNGLHPTRFSAVALMIRAHKSLGNYKQAEELARGLVSDAIQNFGEEEPRTMEVINLLGLVLLSCGKYAEAESHTRKALSLRQQHLGEDASDTLHSLENLANILGRRCDFNAACTILSDLVAKYFKIKGDMDDETIQVMNNYGSLLISMGRFEEAESILFDTYKKRVQLFTEDHPSTLQILGNYALVLILQNKYEAAEKWNEVCLESMKKIKLEERNPIVLRIKHNKAILDMNQGRFLEGLDLIEKVIRLKKQYIGDLHPDTLLSIQIKAQGELKIGSYQSANSLLEFVLEHFRYLIGEDHIYTLGTIHALATLRMMEGKYDESERMHRDRLARSRRLFGLEHRETVKTQLALAQTLSSQKKHNSAIELARDAVDITSRQKGNMSRRTLDMKQVYACILGEHTETYNDSALLYQDLLNYYLKQQSSVYPDVVLIRIQYANVLCRLDRTAEAEALGRENVSLCLQTLGEENFLTLNAIGGLASVLAENISITPVEYHKAADIGVDTISNNSVNRHSRQQESLALRKQAIKIGTLLFGQESEQTLRAVFELAKSYEANEVYEEAFEIAQNVLIARKKLLGPTNPATLASAHQVSQILRELGRNSEAEALCRQTWELRCKVLGDSNRATMDSKSDLAVCLRTLNKSEQALKSYQELLDQKKKIYEPGSLEILHTMNNLAMTDYGLGNYLEAEPLIKAVVEGRTERLGANHLDTLLSTDNLGAVLLKLERNDEAEKVLRNVLQVRKEKLGNLHSFVEDTRQKLIQCLVSQGRRAEVYPLEEESLNCAREKFGPTSSGLILAIQILARSYFLGRDYTRAEELFREVFELRKQSPSDDPREEFHSYQSFAQILKAVGKCAEGETMARKSYEGRNTLLGPEHRDTILSLHILIECLMGQQKYLEAETFCRLALTKESDLGKNHLSTLLTLQQLGYICYGQGKKEETITHFKELLQRLELSNRKEKVQIFTLEDLMAISNELQRFREAQEHSQKLIHLTEKLHGANSLQVAEIAEQVAVVNWNGGAIQKAGEVFRKGFSIYKTHGRTNDEAYLTATSSFAECLIKQNRLPEAQEYCLTCLALNEELSSSVRPPISFHNRSRLARLLIAMKRYTEAETMATAVVSEGSQTLPPNHTAVLAARRTLARLKALTNRQQEALVDMRVVLFMDIELRGRVDRGTLETAHEYGKMCRQAGKFWEAECVLRAALRKKEVVLGVGNSWTEDTRREWVVTLVEGWKRGVLQ